MSVVYIFDQVTNIDIQSFFNQLNYWLMFFLFRTLTSSNYLHDESA